MIYDTTPKADGFRMPGEFEKQRGCIMIWPERPGSWPFGAKKAREAFANVIKAIAKSEKVFLAVNERTRASAEAMLAGNSNVIIFDAETDDAWARDVGPTFLVNDKSELRAVNWEFNAWGGAYNGLYASWDKDNAFAMNFISSVAGDNSDSAAAEAFGKKKCDIYDAAPFVLEGGSIHTDGEGTVIVTESCLLSKGRNPSMTKSEIEDKLKEYLGAEKVIWLPYGIYNDETDEHVDNVCAFAGPAELLLAWTDNEDDPQYEMSLADLKLLEAETDAKGRKFTVHKLPIPDNCISIREEDLEGYEFEDGEDTREVGERLAASYVNFYISNGAVIMPAFGGSNSESDKRAANILKEIFTDREIIMVDALDILLGGGNIHCITQQIPFA